MLLRINLIIFGKTCGLQVRRGLRCGIQNLFYRAGQLVESPRVTDTRTRTRESMICHLENIIL